MAGTIQFKDPRHPKSPEYKAHHEKNAKELEQPAAVSKVEPDKKDDKKTDETKK